MQNPAPPSSATDETLTTSAEDRPPLNEQWQALRNLAAVVRRFNSAMLTTAVPIEELTSITSVLQTQVERLESHERVFGNKAQAQRFAAQTGQLPFTYHEMSPAMGHCNPHAPPLHIWQADGLIHGRAMLGWDYEGPSEHVHGGFVAMLFDQLLGFGQRITGSAGPTGSLTVNYHRMTPLNKPLHLIGEVDRIEGRKKYLKAKLWADDVCTASCEGVFIMAKNAAATPPPAEGA